jgi:hypothetical protein
MIFGSTIIPALPSCIPSVIVHQGAIVTISYDGPPLTISRDSSGRVRFPLVASEQRGAVNLTGEKIAELPNEEEASPRRLVDRKCDREHDEDYELEED